MVKKVAPPSIQIKGTLKQNMVAKTRSNARSHSLSDAATAAKYQQHNVDHQGHQAYLQQ